MTTSLQQLQPCDRSTPSQRDLLKLSRYGELIRLNEGDWLWQETETAKALALVLSGELISYRNNQLGRGKLVLGRHGKGAVLDAAELFGERPHPSSVKAHQTTSLLLLPMNNLERLANSEADLALRLERQLWHATAHQIDHLIGRLAIFS